MTPENTSAGAAAISERIERSLDALPAEYHEPIEGLVASLVGLLAEMDDSGRRHLERELADLRERVWKLEGQLREEYRQAIEAEE